MKDAALISLFAIALAACGAAESRHQSPAPAPAEQASSAAPSVNDMALAAQVAADPLEDETGEDIQRAAAEPQGEYYGQPLAERSQQQALPQARDGLWATLATTRIHEDAERGLYTATPSAAVRALVGQRLTLSGFVMPLDTTARFRHFLLTRYTPVCPFCPPGAPNEVVEVWSATPIAATDNLLRISGQFALTNDGEKGLFFQLNSARVETAPATSGRT